MESSIEIRNWETGDCDQFVELVKAYIQEYLQIEKTHPVHYDPGIGNIYWEDMNKKSDDYVVVVAQVNSRLVGFCIGEVHHYGDIEKHYFDGDKRGEVWDFYVLPEFRNQGLAAKMLSEIESQFKSKGIINMVLNGVDELRNPKAASLYQRLGYRPWSSKYYKKLI